MTKTLFWDFDGTLAMSPRLWSRAILDALIKQVPDCRLTLHEVRMATSGKVCTWDTGQSDYAQYLGSHWWTLMEERFFEKYVELGIDEEMARKAASGVRSEILNLDRYELYEDAVSVLEECCRLGFHNYILSNNYPEMEEVLEGLSLLKYFKGVIASAQIGHDKPGREIFEIAWERAGCPKECYMIGDNPIADMQGAKQLGMKTILVHREIECKDADVIAKTLQEALAIIKTGGL